MPTNNDPRNEDQLQPPQSRTLDRTKSSTDADSDTRSRGSQRGTNDIGGYVPTR